LVVLATSEGLKKLEQRGILKSAAALEELAGPTWPPKLVRDRAASALKLAAYEWLSPSYCLDTPLEECQSTFPDAEDVG